MKILLLILLLASFGVRCWLKWLNLNHLRRFGNRVPQGFAGVISADELARASAYSAAQSSLGFREALLGEALLLWFLFAGGLSRYDRWVLSLSDRFLLQGLAFFLGLGLVLWLLELPFGWYRTFRLEQRFGFNTTTPMLWLTDQFKGLGLSAVIGGTLVSGSLWLVQTSPGRWWFWAWLLFCLVSLFLIFLSPRLIEPLFFKFTPLDDPELEAGVRRLMTRAGLQAGAVQQVDASRRSRHSNAYFTGLGRVKRIVLFDTLLQQLTQAELLAVLAHEIGHWKSGHLLLRLLWSQLVSLVAFFIAWLALQQDWPGQLLNFASASWFAQLLVFLVLAGLVNFLLTPLASGISRLQERQADQFAVQLCENPEALAMALVKLAGDNLANLHPHPWYVWFYYSHPPVVERVRRLRLAHTSN